MLKTERSFSQRQVSDGIGGPVTLVTERLAVTFTVPGAVLGARYESPRRVVQKGVATPIFDWVMVARLFGLLAVLLAMIVRTLQR